MKTLKKSELIMIVLTAVFMLAAGVQAYIGTVSPDEDTVRVSYRAEERTLLTDGSGEAVRSIPGLVDINTAGAEELSRLPGIGETLAQRIVDHRTAEGPFERIEDIMSVNGIGEAKFRDISELIICGEASK